MKEENPEACRKCTESCKLSDLEYIEVDRGKSKGNGRKRKNPEYVMGKVIDGIVYLIGEFYDKRRDADLLLR
tara:strand:- start:66 stop:281 length:216 start_codon:yes stop_codon:yes gene_type:complete